MHNFSASIAEIVILSVAVTLLLGWITYSKTSRIKESLWDLAQDDAQTTANSAEAKDGLEDALDAIPRQEALGGNAWRKV